MASSTDVFYAFCTFWTGDWAWLKERNRGRGTMVSGRYVEIPQCPFCGAVGFEADREVWLRSVREWDEGTSPKAPGSAHPGYLAMVRWGEKQCFRDYAALERTWRETTPQGRAAPAWPVALRGA